MQKSAADFILLIQDELCEALVSPRHFAKIVSLSKGLPPTSLLSIECRLCAANDVDFALCVYERKGFEKLSAFISENNLVKDTESIGQKDWYAIAGFADHWLTQKDFLQELVSAMWLNIDVEKVKDQSPVPWVYVIYQDNFLGKEIMLTVLHESLLIFRTENPPEILNQLAIHLRKLPKHAHVLGLGLQSTRNTEALRLVIYNLNIEEITAFLESSDDRYEIDQLYPSMKSLEKIGDSLGFIFDIDVDGIKPQFGVEFYINKASQKVDVARFTEVLDTQNLCDPIKGNAVKQWPTSKENITESLTCTWVNHFKVNYNYRTAVSAKVYLGFEYRDQHGVN